MVTKSRAPYCVHDRAQAAVARADVVGEQAEEQVAVHLGRGSGGSVAAATKALWRWLSGSSCATPSRSRARRRRAAGRRRGDLEEAAPAVGAVARVEGRLGRADAHQHLGVDVEGGRRLVHGRLVDAGALEHALHGRRGRSADTRRTPDARSAAAAPRPGRRATRAGESAFSTNARPRRERDADRRDRDGRSAGGGAAAASQGRTREPAHGARRRWRCRRRARRARRPGARSRARDRSRRARPRRARG